MKAITILLAAGDPSLLRGLQMRLELEVDFAIVGQAGALDDLAQLAHALAPDMVVLDVDASGALHGTTELVRDLAATHRVVVLSLDDGCDARIAAFEAGAAAFVSKHSSSTALVTAIRDAASRSDDARGAR